MSALAPSDDAAGARVFVLHAILGGVMAVGRHLTDDGDGALEVVRLVEKEVRSAPQTLLAVGIRAAVGQHDQHHPRLLCSELPDQVEPALGPEREIDYRDVQGLVARDRQGRSRVGCLPDPLDPVRITDQVDRRLPLSEVG